MESSLDLAKRYLACRSVSPLHEKNVIRLDSVGVGGTSKWLRRSGATHIEIREPGKARHHLGHRTLDLAAKAYIDWPQVRREMPRPPELAGG